MLSQRCGGRIGQMRRETAQSVRVRESERTRMRSHKGSRGAADILDGRVQHDDVLSRDQFLRRVRRVQRNRPARCDRRRCFGACKRTSGRHDGDAPDKSPHELTPPTEKNVRGVRRGIAKLTVTNITKSRWEDGPKKDRPTGVGRSGMRTRSLRSHAVDVASDAEGRRTRDGIGHDRHGAHQLELHRKGA